MEREGLFSGKNYLIRKSTERKIQYQKKEKTDNGTKGF